MRVRQLGIEGVFTFTPQTFPDERGAFSAPFQEEALVAALGRPLFPVVQVATTRSRRGVVRGLHFTTLPGSMAKYVYCAYGRALDYAVDVRPGSPTFGRAEPAELSAATMTGLYLPVGMGHLFISLEDDTTLVYLMSAGYSPQQEKAIHPLDPALALSIPADLEPIMSSRDQEAPTLEAAQAQGILPDYATCRAIELAGGRP